MGSTGFGVKLLVKVSSQVGGGMEGTKYGGLGPTEMAGNHHQVVVVGGGSVQQKCEAALQLTLRGCGALK